MDHSFYQERLSAYLDRELPAEEMEAVAQHLAGCADCLGRLEQLKSLDRFTSQHSALDDSDYWEQSAQKIEARIAFETGKVTDIKPARGSLYAGLWWKLPAIAASIVIVGYIGLHESEIVHDGMLIPPTEQAAPDVRPTDDKSLRIEATSEADQPIDREIQAESKVESGEAAGAESRESRQDVGPAIALPSAAEPKSIVKPRPEPTPDDGQIVLPSHVTPPPELPMADEPTDRYKSPTPQASSLGQAVKVSKDESDKIKGVDETAPGFTNESSNLAEKVVDSEKLKSWRDRRDSLITLRNVLESGTSPSAAKSSKFGAVTKLRSDASTTEAPPDSTRAALERLDVDLVEAWYRVCLLSDDPLEINRGTEYLKDVAFDQQTRSGERARRYLELLDR
jgi:hypothetical protein